MGRECFFGASVRIGAGDDVHPQAAAPFCEFTKGIAVAQEFTAIVKRDFGWIKSHTTTGAEAGGIGVNFLEVPQPHGQVVVAWVVFRERYLSPTHGPVEPAGILRGRGLRQRNLLPKSNS